MHDVDTSVRLYVQWNLNDVSHEEAFSIETSYLMCYLKETWSSIMPYKYQWKVSGGACALSCYIAGVNITIDLSTKYT